MLSFKIYRACLLVTIFSLTALVFSWRYRRAKGNVTESPQVPACMMYERPFSVGQSVYIDSNYCTLETVSSGLENANHLSISDSRAGVSTFFRKCKHHPQKVFIQKGEIYELNWSVLTPANLKAIGYMLSLAYALGVYVDIKFNDEFLISTFKSITTLANELPKPNHVDIVNHFKESCHRDNLIKYFSWEKTFANVERTFGTNCASFETLKLQLEKQDSHKFPSLQYLPLISGRECIFWDKEVAKLEAKDDFISNFHDRLSASEPIRLRNWWMYGFQKSAHDHTVIYSCLRRLPRDKLQMLFTLSTGLDEMPFGGASRLSRRIDLNFGQQYSIEDHVWHLNRDFNCKLFEAEIDRHS